MNIDAALLGVTRLGFDTSPLIYFIEVHPQYVALVRNVFQRITVGRIEGVTSMITLAEVLVQPLLYSNVRLCDEYRDVLLQSDRFHTLSIDATLAEQAANLRGRYRLRLPDALQLAVALSEGCQAFLTNDRQLQRVTELRVLVLDDLEL